MFTRYYHREVTAIVLPSTLVAFAGLRALLYPSVHFVVLQPLVFCCILVNQRGITDGFIFI